MDSLWVLSEKLIFETEIKNVEIFQNAWKVI